MGDSFLSLYCILCCNLILWKNSLHVQSQQTERAANVMGFRASVAAKDIHISSETDPRVHSSSSTISHHLRFDHLNCHENKEDDLGTENAQTSGLESAAGKDVLLRGSFSNEAVSSDRTSREGINSIGSELENVTNNVSAIGSSVSESDFSAPFMTSERIITDLEGERASQGISFSTVVSSERSDSSQSSLTSMLPNTSTASSVIGESTPDSVPTSTDITILSGSRGQTGGSILHDDMMSIFSNDGLRQYRDSSSSETRRSHRRVLWDALSRRGSRGFPDSDTEDLGFYSTWLDLGDDLFGELEESRYSHRRRHGSIRVNQYSRSRVIVIATVTYVFAVTFICRSILCSHVTCSYPSCYRLGSIAVLFLIVGLNKGLLLARWGFIKLVDALVILS